MTVDRRAFLVGLGGVIAAGMAAERGVSFVRRRSVREWVGRLSDPGGARDLGVEYLARYPDEDGDGAALLGHLASLVPLLGLAAPDRALAGFSDRLRRDFADGDVVRMGGWLLSRTELRLCALLSLDESARTGVHGVFTPYTPDGGTPVYWTAPSARLAIPAGTAVEFRVQSGAGEPQQVAVRFGGEVIDERTVWGGDWQPVRYGVRATDSPSVLALTVTPPWRPPNDFRTIGVGLDRVW